jgi:leucyl-tRNA synthetase
MLREDLITLVVQVDGKLRDKLEVAADLPKDEVEKVALASSKVQTFTQGRTIVKVVVVPGRLVNIVTKA